MMMLRCFVMLMVILCAGGQIHSMHSLFTFPMRRAFLYFLFLFCILLDTSSVQRDTKLRGVPISRIIVTQLYKCISPKTHGMGVYPVVFISFPTNNF